MGEEIKADNKPDYIVLNLGCGDNLMEGAINVDVHNDNADTKMDLMEYLDTCQVCSIDEIHMTHVIEHFPDPKPIIMKCWKKLRYGGTLHIIVPHSTCAMAIGCMGHYRTYSYSTLDDYLARPFYMFGNTLFRTKFQALRWWYNRPTVNVPKWMYLFIYPANFIINKLIKLSPRVFENFWWPYVGGAREVEWIGEKI